MPGTPTFDRSPMAILDDPHRNKGTAFTEEERKKLGLSGLLPHAVETLDRQVDRVMEHLRQKPNDLEKYIYLTGLLDRNETLFYRVVMSDPKRFLPIVYDPTVGEACLKFGHIYRRSRGLYVSLAMKGHVAEILRNWPERDVRFICVSTGGRILGLGDLGANGMGIPIGKLQLYTACAAVPPSALLPVLLDIGTTRKELRDDPLYLGLRREPPPPEELDAFVDEFVQAVQQVFPGCCIHFEDWKGTDAIRLLAKYADKILCYNDDIQGTAAVALAGLTTALQIINAPLTEQRILFLGAGSAGIGIANLIASAMQAKGLSGSEAASRISLFDINGLIEPSRQDLSPSQKVYAHPTEPSRDLVAVIERFRPTALIGVSTQGGAFDQRVVEAMSRLNARPIIFPLSNPTEKAECTPEQAYRWSKGKALYAAGVQFPDVTVDGKTYHPGQANNFYIFPAIGLATYAARPRRITDQCFIVAAEASADQVGSDLKDKGMLFPSQSDILATEIAIAQKVAAFMFDQGLATIDRPTDIGRWIEGQLYRPEYRQEAWRPDMADHRLKDLPIGLDATGSRTETDSMGSVSVPADRYWGAQTQRSLIHFSIGNDRMPKEVYRAYGVVKKAAALVNRQEGRLEDWKTAAIVKVADEVIDGKLDDHFPLFVWQTGSGTQSNMNVNEVISNRAIQLLGGTLGTKSPVHPNDDVNMGMSSNDSFPTAMHIATVKELNDHLLPQLEALAKAIDAKADAWKTVVKIGRTHLEDAVPLTAGQEWSGYAHQLREAIAELRHQRQGLMELAIGGTAVGTGLNAPPGFSMKVAAKIADLTGQPYVTAPNKFAAQGSLDAMVRVSAGLRGAAVALMKIANDIRWLASGPRCGLGELELPENEPGSSIMPGKVNPTQCEAMVMIAIQVIGDDTAVAFAGSQGNFELNAMRPIIVNNVLHSARVLADGCEKLRQFCIEGTRLNDKRIHRYVEDSVMLVTALSPVIGYDKASRIAHKAMDEDISLKQAALKSGDLDEQEFDRLVNPLTMVGRGYAGA